MHWFKGGWGCVGSRISPRWLRFFGHVAGHPRGPKKKILADWKKPANLMDLNCAGRSWQVTISLVRLVGSSWLKKCHETFVQTFPKRLQNPPRMCTFNYKISPTYGDFIPLTRGFVPGPYWGRSSKTPHTLVLQRSPWVPAPSPLTKSWIHLCKL